MLKIPIDNRLYYYNYRNYRLSSVLRNRQKFPQMQIGTRKVRSIQAIDVGDQSDGQREEYAVAHLLPHGKPYSRGGEAALYDVEDEERIPINRAMTIQIIETTRVGEAVLLLHVMRRAAFCPSRGVWRARSCRPWSPFSHGNRAPCFCVFSWVDTFFS